MNHKNYIILIYLFFLIACTPGETLEPGMIRADFSPVAEEDPKALLTILPSEESGVRFVNLIQDLPHAHINTYEYYYNGGGVAIGDLNNNGLPDLFFTGNMVSNRLYFNKGDMIFEDVSESSGIYNTSVWSTGVTLVDINLDGWLDIYVCNSGPANLISTRQNFLYVNNQDGTFSEQSFDFGLVDNSYSTQAVFFDYDLDEDLDLFIMNHTDFINRFKVREFVPKVQKMEEFMEKSPLRNDFYNILYKNNGDGTFINVTEEANLQKWGFGLGLVASDVNGDGFIDIYVANDYFVPDFLFMNNGDGTFHEGNKEHLKRNSQFSMGCDIADINNDGFVDISTVDMVSAERVRNKTLMAPMNEQKFFYLTRNKDFQKQYMFNAVQLNNGNGNFSEIGHLLGTTQTDWSWTSLFCDFDLDGNKDYLVTNGFRRDTRNRDILKQNATNRDNNQDVLARLSRFPSVPMPNYVFRNSGDLQFEDMSTQWGFIHPSFSNGAAYGDLDLDGDLDLVMNNIDQPAFIYKNNAVDQEKYFLNIKMSPKPKFANAKITLYARDTRQFQEFTPTRGYLSSMDYLMSFGIHNAEPIDSVSIVLPNKTHIVLKNLDINQVINISDYEDQFSPIQSKNNSEQQLFTIQEFPEIDYRHVENLFYDFATEVLLPHRQSRNGPHISVADVDGDGREDFFVGGAKDQSGILYRQNTNRTFSPINLKTFNDDAPYEDLGAHFFDYDGDGDQDLYVVSGGGGDVRSTLNELADRLYENDGRGNFRRTSGVIPNMITSGMRVESIDFENDGDLDLFIGGRVIPGQYPKSPKSHLLLNNNGKFEDVTSERAQGLSNIGMVTDFDWVDMNNDGVMDLVVVGEWMNIEIFIQKEGRLILSTDQFFDGDERGWWFSVAARDMDNDGDIDLIAGNLGLNNKFHPTEKKPLEIFFNDFDNNGTGDIVLAKTDDEGNNYVLRGKDCSTEQMPFISEKFEKYEDFALASIDEVFEESKIEEAINYSISDFSSAYFENVNGKFVRKPLPIRTQFAPINDILVDDFDNDGYLDAIVAGNHFDTEIETASYDAGTGVFLKGDGKGNFKDCSVAESGLYLGGNLKDLALIQIGNHRYLIGANNNDALDFIRINANKRNPL